MGDLPAGLVRGRLPVVEREVDIIGMPSGSVRSVTDLNGATGKILKTKEKMMDWYYWVIIALLLTIIVILFLLNRAPKLKTDTVIKFVVKPWAEGNFGKRK